jgi:hypothetical protein
LKIPRYTKLGEVWSAMFRIYTGLDDGQHHMLMWLRLACSFDDDIFEGDAIMMGWINDPPVGTHLRINVPALKSWKCADGNLSFITNALIKLDTSKQYLAAVANVRALDQISREVNTNIDYKDKTKHTLKLLIIAIRASPTWRDEKWEKIKKYTVLKLGNELSRSTNNEQAERMVINRDKFERRVLIPFYAHHQITMIPFNKSDRSQKLGCLTKMLKITLERSQQHWTLPCAQQNHQVHDLHSIIYLKEVSTE